MLQLDKAQIKTRIPSRRQRLVATVARLRLDGTPGQAYEITIPESDIQRLITQAHKNKSGYAKRGPVLLTIADRD